MLESTLRFLTVFVASLLLTHQHTAYAGASAALADEATSTGGPPMDPNRLSHQERKDRLEALLEGARDLRAQIDRSQFDFESLLIDLEFEGESIVEFVREHVAFQAYEGLLRGAEGTLLSRAGNALDQAVLTAKLLGDAGYDARIVGGTLTKQDAERLLRGAQSPVLPDSPFIDATKARQIMERMAEAAGREVDMAELLAGGSAAGETSEVLFRVKEEAKAESDRLLAHLVDAGVALDSTTDALEALSQARRYYWVEWQETAGTWINEHPAFGSSDAPRVEASEYFSDAIPPSLQHRVAIRSEMSRVMGNRIEVVELMPRWERPAANLAERAITYTHTSMAIPEGGQTAWSFLATSDTFAPTLDGQVASDDAFDILGTKIPMMAVQAAGSNVLRTAGEKAGAAESALSALGKAPSDDTAARRAIAEIRLEIEAIRPGGGSDVITRVVYNPCTDHAPIGPPEPCFPEAPGEAERVALAGTHTVAVAVGTRPESYLLDRVLERLVENAPVWRLTIDPERRESIEAWASVESADTSWLGHLLLADNFDQPLNGATPYRPEPTLSLFQQRLENKGETYLTALDVLSSRKRLIEDEADGLKSSIDVLVRQGVWESAAEQYFMLGELEPTLMRAFPLQRASNARVLHSSSDLAAANNPALTEAFDDGFIVVARQDFGTTPTSELAWYRVDTVTGETIGTTSDGRGGFVEYLGKAVLAMMIVAPVYWAGCRIAGHSNTECVMFGRSAAAFGLGAVTFAVALFSTIVFWPAEAY